jgi:hypothetical protein
LLALGQGPGCRDGLRPTADAHDLVGHGGDQRPELAAVPRGEPAGEAEQHAQLIDLEQIRQVLGVVPGEQIPQVLEERLSGQHVPEDLFLQRAPVPFREHGIAGAQHRLVEKRDEGVDRQLHVLRVVARSPGLPVGGGQELLDVVPEGARVRGDLSIGPQAHRDRDAPR